MAIVPASKLGKIQFYEAHITPWTNNAVAIGLDLPQVAALTTATEAARDAYNNHVAAQAAAKAATQAFYDAVATMHSGPGLGSDMIAAIKNFAKSTNDPNVYALAQIPAPTPPGVVGPPGTPYAFSVGLLQDGALELKWKCDNPSGATGTVYEILRSDAGAPFKYVNTAGEKTYTDNTLGAGTSPVTYQITGVRSSIRGNPAQFTVQFGAGGAVLNASSDSGDGSASDPFIIAA